MALEWIVLIVMPSLIQVSIGDECELCKKQDIKEGEQLTCSNVTALFFENFEISVPKTRSLVCINCSLTDLNENLFSTTLNGIIHLSLINSHVKQVNKNAFKNFPVLKTLNLHDNEIEVLGLNIFSNMTRLLYLDVSKNKVRLLTPNLFLDSKNLDLLNLNKNLIYGIHPDTFVGLGNLKYLYLSHNRLKIIERNIFRHLLSLKILYLENNEITEIFPEAFDSLKLLMYLYLNNNKITHLSPYNFKYLVGLVGLQLRNNLLEKIPASAFNGLKSVRFLNLGKNNLKKIQPYGFIGLDSLQVLDLMENYFDSFTFTYFNDIKNLKVVWLNNNNLNNFTINYKSFPHYNLIVLGLSVNNLTSLNYQLLFNKLPNISHVFMADNPWKCQLLVNMYNFFQSKSVYSCFNENCSNSIAEAYINEICSLISLTTTIDPDFARESITDNSDFLQPNIFLVQMFCIILIIFINFR